MYQATLHHYQKQTGNQGDPNLYLYRICALAIEIFQWKVLFYLFEQQLYLPTLAIYGNDFIGIRVHIVCEQMDNLVFLYAWVCYNMGMMCDCLCVHTRRG